MSKAKIAALAFLVWSSNPGFGEPIRETLDIDGVPIEILVFPDIEISGQTGVWNATIQLDVDTGDLKNFLADRINKRYVDNHCGDRLWVQDAQINPNGSGALVIPGAIKYEIFACPPKVFGLPIGGGALVFQQGGDFEIILSPTIKETQVSVEATVSKLNIDGALGIFARSLGLERLIRMHAEAEANNALQDFVFNVPQDLSAYNILPRQANFFAIEDRLGLRFLADASITQEQLNAVVGQLSDVAE